MKEDRAPCLGVKEQQTAGLELAKLGFYCFFFLILSIEMRMVSFVHYLSKRNL